MAFYCLNACQLMDFAGDVRVSRFILKRDLTVNTHAYLIGNLN